MVLSIFTLTLAMGIIKIEKFISEFYNNENDIVQKVKNGYEYQYRRKVISTKLEENPISPKTFYQYSRIIQKEGDFKKAVMLMRKALASEPMNPLYRYEYAVDLCGSGDYCEASIQAALARKLKRKRHQPDYQEYAGSYEELVEYCAKSKK